MSDWCANVVYRYFFIKSFNVFEYNQKWCVWMWSQYTRNTCFVYHLHSVLQVFPQAIAYNRLTGAFEEIEGPSRSIAGSALSTERTLSYGATDEEREKMLEWARQERLPLFFRFVTSLLLRLCTLFHLYRSLFDKVYKPTLTECILVFLISARKVHYDWADLK